MKHRKLTSLLAAALLAFPAAVFPPAPLKPPAITAQAATEYTSEDGRFKYTRNGSKAVNITKYLGTETNVTIPSYLDGNTNQKVVAIGASAFKDNKKIKKVTIPAEVQYILEHAFDNCTKMTKVTIKGRCRIDDYAFYNCTALKNLVMNDPTCYTFPSGKYGLHIFTNCTSLKQINGKDVIYYTSVSGYQKPRLRKEQQYNDPTQNIIKTFFTRSEHVGFVDQYCTELCCWIRDTQTRDWMSDAIKARQYYDWLIDHCSYEDEKGSESNIETRDDPENHLYSSVFLSYGLGIRGSECGETVCVGFSKAFTMLLNTSGITSYVIGQSSNNPDKPGHVWNLVKIRGNYYQCDVTFDDNLTEDPDSDTILHNGISHKYFLKSNFDMKVLHNSRYNYPVVKSPTENCFFDSSPAYVHPLANYDTVSDSLITQCTSSLTDKNEDGILDGDWNFNGVVNQSDSIAYTAACWKMNRSSIPQNEMWKYLNKLIKVWEMSPYDVYSDYMFG